MSNDFRRALEEELTAEVRMGQNITDAIDQTVSDMFGVNRTDARCMDIIERHGSITAGDLAREAALSTGAVTALLDRLERIGAVRRVADPYDRRKVLVELTPETVERTGEIFGPIAKEGQRMIADYSDDELRLIVGFLRRGREMSNDHLARIREQAAKLKAASADMRAASDDMRAAGAELKRVAREVKGEMKGEVKAARLRVKEQVKEPVKRAKQQVKQQLKAGLKRSARGRPSGE